MNVNRFAFAIWLCISFALHAAEPQTVVVFVPQEDGFRSIRIPSLVTTTQGTLLAFAEGRAADADQAQNKIILKRSSDGGKSWQAASTIAADGAKALNNPCAVVDRSNGRILLMYQSYPAGISERSGKILPGYEGDSVVRNWIITSDDDGTTWSKPRDITRSTKREKVVTTIASGPGIGIQLTQGKHAGRILMPLNEGPFGQWNIYVAYSDDGGTSWHTGNNAPGNFLQGNKTLTSSTVNEVQVVELSDGQVMLNARRWAGKPVRKFTTSDDGGETWANIQDANELQDPSCMGSIIRYPAREKPGASYLLYSGPNSTSQRKSGTIYLSKDDGKSWPLQQQLEPGSFAYSCLTVLPSGEIGCLYEADETKRIAFARFSLDWLLSNPHSSANKQEERP